MPNEKHAGNLKGDNISSYVIFEKWFPDIFNPHVQDLPQCKMK